MIVYPFRCRKHLQASHRHVRFTSRAYHVIASLILLNWLLTYGTVQAFPRVLYHPFFQTSFYLLSWFKHGTSEPVVPLHLARRADLGLTCTASEASSFRWDTVHHTAVGSWTILDNFRIPFKILIYGTNSTASFFLSFSLSRFCTANLSTQRALHNPLMHTSDFSCWITQLL